MTTSARDFVAIGDFGDIAIHEARMDRQQSRGMAAGGGTKVMLGVERGRGQMKKRVGKGL